MKNWFAQQALAIALPLIIGPLAFLATQWLKAGIYSLDKAGATVKQAVVLTLTFVLAGAVKFVGDALPGVCILGDAPTACLQALTDPNAMKVLVGALVAIALHAGKKQAETGAPFRR